MAKTAFSISVDIEAPPPRVWAVMSDVERWHEWTASIRRITRRDAGPLRVGSSAMVRQPKFPPALWKVTELNDGSDFTWVNRAPGLRVVGRHAVAPIDGGTRATLSIDYSGLFGPLLASLTHRITEEYLGLEAAGLKRRSETG